MISALLASGLLDDLGINLKVLVTQVVIFSITFLLLSRVLFGKALDFMKKREEDVRASHEAITRDRAEVARLTKEYEAHIAKVEKQAYERTQEILKEALAAAGASVARAQADAKSEMERAVGQMAREGAGCSAEVGVAPRAGGGEGHGHGSTGRAGAVVQKFAEELGDLTKARGRCRRSSSRRWALSSWSS
jgi:F0F1-type ATP synthase membrane subunit b/b'